MGAIRKIKIVYDLREILFQKRGWERYGVGLLGELIKFKDLELSYIVQNEAAAKKTYPSLFIKRINVKEMKINPAARKGLPTDKFIEDHDIFHSLTDYPEFIPRKAKLITSVHDLSFHLFPSYHRKDFVNLMRGNLKDVTRYSSAVVCFAKITRTRLEEFMNKSGIKNNLHVSVIPHGIDKHFKKQPKTEIRKTLKKFSINKPHLLYVGSLDKDKNIANLIKAFQASGSIRGHILVLSGPKGRGSFPAGFSDRNIMYLGNICEKDLRNLYSSAKFFISASLDEGFGFCPLEALRCGTPVLCSDIPCFKEMLKTNAVYFNPDSIRDIAKTIGSAINDELFFDKTRKAVFSELNWKNSAKLTLNLYKNVMEANRYAS